MLYGLRDKPKRIGEWIGFVLQYVLCVLPATVLICSICGTDISAGLVSAGLGTLVFLCITGFKCAMVTSNSGATVSAVVGAIALSGSVEKDFTGVVIGGAVMMIIYCIAGLLVKKFGTGWLRKLMPPVVSGTTIIVIGASLCLFIPTYAQVNGEFSWIGMGMCFLTLLIAVLVGHYGKGVIKTLPFLIALVVGDLVAIGLTAGGVAELVDFDKLRTVGIFGVPHFAFYQIDLAGYDWSNLPKIVLMFGLVSLAAMTEHIADVTTAGQVAGVNYVETPGLHRTLIGDGVSSFVGSLTGAQMTTTYSEYTGTMAVSGCASVWVTLGTAFVLIASAFVVPFTNFLACLPNSCFAGVSVLAYGAIANTGVQTLMRNSVDFSNNRNLFIFGAMFAVGVSGLYLPVNAEFSISGVVFAMIVGIVLNVMLKEKKNERCKKN